MTARTLATLGAAMALCACSSTQGLVPVPEGGVPLGQPGGTLGSCLAGKMLESLGENRLLIGAQMEDDIAASAPFDLRYIYLAAGVPDGAGPCSSCASGCVAGGNCSNASGGCSWWGCWQDDQLPPGQYVKDHVQRSKDNGQLPMFTYYQFLYASGQSEGPAQVDAAANATVLSRYFNDYRFFLQKLGGEKALIHLEPDLWAYAQHRNANAHALNAAVKTANAQDCATLENSFSGLGKCLVVMTRKYAPAAKVAFHASSWSTGVDVSLNTNASFDLGAEAAKTVAYLTELGAKDADFVVVEASDRDAGYYASTGQSERGFWDATDATLPNFAQALTWVKAISEGLGKANLWWQLPVGNMSLNNTAQHWKDNRVEYFFAHTPNVAIAHGFGMAFGSGADDQTNPSTDNGQLVAKTKAYGLAGGQAVCP
jgi:hypothetical protein